MFQIQPVGIPGAGDWFGLIDDSGSVADFTAIVAAHYGKLCK